MAAVLAAPATWPTIKVADAAPAATASPPVASNSRDLMETLFAINLTLFREYKYVPGNTVLQTTLYDVFTAAQGVCQDFSNLFIGLARLLGIPGRLDHVREAVGRHYRDPAPTERTIYCPGVETMNIPVSVQEANA